MFRFLLLSGFTSVAWGQGGISCGAGFVFNAAASSCLPAASSSNCCDAALASCQDAIKFCMINTSPVICQALACPSIGASPMPGASPMLGASPTTPTCCDPALIACQTAIRMCLTNTSNPQLCQALACPTASVSPIRTQSQYSTTNTASASPNTIVSSTATTTPKQADVSATTTYKQTDSSASNTPRQGDVSATTTYKQTDSSASNTPRQGDVSATTTYKQTDSSATMKPADPLPSASAKPTPSVFPTRFIKYSFSIRPRPSQFLFPTLAPPPVSVVSSLVFPKANHTLLRDPAKLQELQIILGCILQLPLESIQITGISTNSANLPFDDSIPRLNSNGEIVCITLPSVASTQGAPIRSLQTSDTTVTYNILNANNLFLIDKNTFANTVANDPNMLSYASSVGSSTPAAIPPYMLFTIINPDPSTVPVQSASAGAIVGGIFGGILVAGLLGVIVYAVVRFRHRAATPITASKKPSVKISNPLNYTHDSHVLFTPVPTRRSA